MDSKDLLTEILYTVRLVRDWLNGLDSLITEYLDYPNPGLEQEINSKKGEPKCAGET